MLSRQRLKPLFCGLMLSVTAAANSVWAAAEAINIYSYRQPFLIKPMLEAFTEDTGIRVNVVYAKRGLIQRLVTEGKNSRADLVLTADIGPLYNIKVQGLTQPIRSDTLRTNIPSQYRDPDNHWFGLTSRARIIFASKERVGENIEINYEDLADPKWRGRICTRSGKHSYNLALIGAMIERHGETETERWLEGFKSNLARKPQGNDRAQVKAVQQGVCDLALGNSYYFGKMITNSAKPEQIGWAKSVHLLFPNQQDVGTHMNISGVALLKHAPNRENAIRLIEFLSGPMAQYMYAQDNFEFPVRPGTPRSSLINAYMGDFKADSVELAKVAANRAIAAELVDRTNFDR